MSEVNIGLVVEGTTDAIVLKASLDAFIDVPYITSTLQPEVPIGTSKTGWGGVYRWCRQMASFNSKTLSDNPSLLNQDLIIIQIDADVARMNYAEAGIQNPVFDDLPCYRPCPPASDTVDVLLEVVNGWLSPTFLGDKGIICVPSKCIEAWVAAGIYSQSDPELMNELECSYEVIAYFQNKPAKERLVRSKAGKLKKNAKKYSELAELLTQKWKNIKYYCPQAQVFQKAVENSLSFL